MKFKLYPAILLLALFSLTGFYSKGQTTDCTSGDNAVCVDARADLCASFIGDALNNITNSSLVFTGTATGTTTSLSFTSRTYTVTANGCVVIQFDQAGTGSVSSTNITVNTNTGATITCNNVTVDGSGHACVRICDARLSTGVLITFTLTFNATTNFASGQTVQLASFGTAGTSRCSATDEFACPTSFVPLPNDCVTSCNASFPIPAGKIRVYFASPIPIGQPTPVINAVTSVNGGAVSGQYIFCLNADAGTSVERSFADYCIFTNVANPSPILNTTGTLGLTLQSGTFSQTCLLSVCASGGYILLSTNDCPATPACAGVTGTLVGKVRVIFVTPIPIGVPTPTLTGATVAGITLAGYKF